MPILCIGRNTAFALVRSAQIKSIRTGKQIRILKHELLEYLTGGTGTTAPWTDAAEPLTMGDDSCRAAKACHGPGIPSNRLSDKQAREAE